MSSLRPGRKHGYSHEREHLLSLFDTPEGDLGVSAPSSFLDAMRPLFTPMGRGTMDGGTPKLEAWP